MGPFKLTRRNGASAVAPLTGFWALGSLQGALDPAIPNLPLLSPTAAPQTSTPPFAVAEPPRWAFEVLFRAPPGAPQSALGLLTAAAAPPASFPPIPQMSFLPQLMGR